MVCNIYICVNDLNFIRWMKEIFLRLFFGMYRVLYILLFGILEWLVEFVVRLIIFFDCDCYWFKFFVW